MIRLASTLLALLSLFTAACGCESEGWRLISFVQSYAQTVIATKEGHFLVAHEFLMSRRAFPVSRDHPAARHPASKLDTEHFTLETESSLASWVLQSWVLFATGPLANTNPWRYTTRYLDEETGLYYFGRRYFDPVTGQWLSRELLGESECHNLYSYCHNDPVNKVDVLGFKERVIAGSAPAFFTVPGDEDHLYVGFPLEEDGWFSPFMPNHKHSIIPARMRKSGLFAENGYYSTPAAINRLRSIAQSQLELDYWLDVEFYLANGSQLVGGTAEMAAGIVAAPQSAGVSMVATVHGFDVANTAWLRLAAGRGNDIQSGTSQLLQFIPGVDRGTAERLDVATSFVSIGGTMWAAGRAPLAFTPGIGGAAESGFASGLTGPSFIGNSRVARLAFLKTFRSTGFRNAAVSFGYTNAELHALRSQLLQWSKNGQIGVQWNPLLGGYATPNNVSIGFLRLLRGGQPLQNAAGHELTHMLQEIRYGALTAEQAGNLTRQQVRFFEWQGAAGGRMAIGGMPGWREDAYGRLASWLWRP